MFDNFTDLIAYNARRRPLHPALSDATRTLDYATLDPLVTRSALALQASGIAIGDIVGVGMTDTIDHLVMLLAIARLGAVILPMDHRWTTEEMARIARQFAIRAVLLDPEQPGPSATPSIRIDAGWHALVAAQPSHGTFPQDRSLPMQLSMSSGTTGTPKGPMTSHGFAIERARSGGSVEADRFLLATPLYFGGGRNFSFATLFTGGTVVLFPPPYRLPALIDAVNTQAITWTFLVPTQLRRLLRLAGADGVLFPGLRLLVCSGAPLFPDERAEVIARVCPNLVNVYATTEGGVISALPASADGEPARSVGRAVFMSEFEIVDEAHMPLPPRIVGRIRHRSPTTPTCFYNNPTETALYFRDGWYYTGDLGWYDEGGFLYLAGRSKDMIIRGGVNIYPAEIEEPLLRDPRVQDCAAVAWPAREMGEEIALFVIAAGAITESEVLDAARGALAAYKVPRRVFFVDEMPRNNFGKVLRHELAKRLPPFETVVPIPDDRLTPQSR